MPTAYNVNTDAVTVAKSRTFRDPKLTPAYTLLSVRILRPGINWTLVLPSSEYQVLPSCQGLRDQAWSADREQSAKQIPAGLFGHRESLSCFLPFSIEQRPWGNPTFLTPSRAGRRLLQSLH